MVILIPHCGVTGRGRVEVRWGRWCAAPRSSSGRCRAFRWHRCTGPASCSALPSECLWPVPALKTIKESAWNRCKVFFFPVTMVTQQILPPEATEYKVVAAAEQIWFFPTSTWYHHTHRKNKSEMASWGSVPCHERRRSGRRTCSVCRRGNRSVFSPPAEPLCSRQRGTAACPSDGSLMFPSTGNKTHEE